MDDLIKKIKKKKFIVGIIGLGYIGLPRALQFANKKIKVIGFDSDKNKIEMLKKGNSYLSHFQLNKNSQFLKKYFYPTSDFKKINEVDIIITCLPTPLKNGNLPDLSFLKKSFNLIFPYLKYNQSIVLESTSYPGTTNEIYKNKLNKKFNLGENFFLIYSPEREDPGRKTIKREKIPKLVSGYSNLCLKIGVSVYKNIFNKVIKVTSIENAEMTKIYENIFRSVNIGLVNEMKKISEKMNIDIDEIIKLASTKPYGFFPFYPGPGLGGHCIPIDPFYLSWKAAKIGIKTEFIELSGKINRSMPNWIFSKIKKHFKKKIDGKKCLLIGLAYKKDIGDCRESPTLVMMDILKKNNINFKYHDPLIKKIPKLRNYSFNLDSINLTKKNIKKFDFAIILTNHTKINYNMLLQYSKVIFDTRNSFKKISNKIIKC